MQYQLRVMSLGEVLDTAVQLVKDHFKLFFGIAGVLYFPFVLLMNWFGAFAAADLQGGAVPSQMLEENLPLLMLSGVFFILWAIFAIPLMNAAIIYAIASQYLGTNVTVGDSVKAAFGTVLPLIGTNILKGLAVMLGFFLCIFPGIYLAFRFALSDQVVVIEDRAGTAALSRSGEIMRGHYGYIFVLFLILGVISLSLDFVTGFIPVAILSALIYALGNTLVYIFTSAALVTFYFSARCKNENFDLTVLADAVGQPAQA